MLDFDPEELLPTAEAPANPYIVEQASLSIVPLEGIAITAIIA